MKIKLNPNQLEQTINCENLASGFYIYKVTANGKITNQGKLNIIK